MTQPPVFILEEPHYHRIRFGEPHHFRGVALAVEGPEIDRVEIVREGRVVAEAAVDRDCPELGGFVRLPRAATSRFELDLVVERGAPYEFRAHGVPLFLYDIALVEREEARMQRLAGQVEALPAPSPELVATTQGGSNVDSYRESIVSGVITTQAFLDTAGVDRNDVRAVLDIGCGTGRLLAGWHCDDPTRRLAGVDINADLIGWNREQLAGVAEWNVSTLYPPLEFPDESFDLIQLASVFTHLPLDCQQAWVAEIRRLLRPNGTAIITTHGEIYARLLLDPSSHERYLASGHVEVAGAAEGANAYATFHTAAFARELFAAFDSVAHFPRGMVDGVLRWFPIAALQDVWLLRRSS